MSSKSLLITGGTGMVGKAILNILPKKYSVVAVGSKDYDLTKQNDVYRMLLDTNPSKIIHLAAKVGGVKSNSEHVADFYTQNILINTNLLLAAHENNIQNIISLLSTCIYPDEKWVNYPLTEEQLHLGPPHNSNYGYAYAKRMLEVQSRAYRQQYGRNYMCVVPNNIGGPYDNFNLENGHVFAATIRKIYEAKMNNVIPTFWGDGSSLREFTAASDIAQCLLKIIGEPYGQVYNLGISANIGNNEEISIKELVELVCKEFNYNGPINWDNSKLSGQKRKPSKHTVHLKHEYKPVKILIKETCQWFKEIYPNIRGINR